MFGFFIATPTGSCFGCQSLFKRPIREKFAVWSPSNWINIIDHIGCGLALATIKGNCYFYLKLIKGQTRLKFGMYFLKKKKKKKKKKNR